MVGKIRIVSYGRDGANTMFSWSGENDTENIGYSVKIKERSNVKMPKTT